MTGIAARFGAFVAERHPLALAGALDALEAVARGPAPTDSTRPGRAQAGVSPGAWAGACRSAGSRGTGRGRRLRTSAETRLEQAYERILDVCDGFFRRAAIQGVSDR